MKKLLLLTALAVLASGLFAQTEYSGTPWQGADNPWEFSTNNDANFQVGKAYLQRPDKSWYFNGIPHVLYDIGAIDTTKRPGDDPTGLLAGGAYYSSSNRTGTEDNRAHFAGDSVTMDATDIFIRENSDVFRGQFTSHKNRGVFDRTGGWYRYTCNFYDGNYKMVLRTWGNTLTEMAIWVRFYDKATMAPLYPWTRLHPGSGTDATDPSALMEGVDFLDVNQTMTLSTNTFDNFIDKVPNKTKWMISDDQFSLNGTVVMEISSVGPTEGHGLSVRNTGGALGEISFEYIGAQADAFAPVAEPWMDEYSEWDEISLSLSEDGTLYLVPDGTLEADLETANIDKVEMVTTDTYTKACSEFTLPETIQLVTKDAGGNMRFSGSIMINTAVVYQEDYILREGANGDAIELRALETGIAALVPADVTADYASVMAAVDAGNADTLSMEPGNGNLHIINLNADQACKIYLLDTENSVLSTGLDYTLNFIPVVSADATAGVTGDVISVTGNVDGIVAVVPDTVIAEYANIWALIEAYQADTVTVLADVATDLTITNLTSTALGCQIYLIDKSNNQLSNPLDFKLNLTLTASASSGKNGDVVSVTGNAAGFVALVPVDEEVPAYYGSVMDAIGAGNADTVNVLADVARDLTITNLNGNIACQLIMVDTSDNALNVPLDFQLSLVLQLSASPAEGQMGDVISVSGNAAGFVVLVPATVTADYASLIAEIDASNADSVNVLANVAKDLTITNLDADLACKIYLVDTSNNALSDAVDFQLTMVPLIPTVTADITSGENGDVITVSGNVDGFVVLVPATTPADYESINASIAINLADAVDVVADVPTELTITNLSGDMACKIYLVAASDNALSAAVDFQLNEGTGISNEILTEVRVYMQNDKIIVEHNAEFKELFVFDILGKQHIRMNASDSRISIDASMLKNGIYILKITGTSEPVTKKFLLGR